MGVREAAVEVKGDFILTPNVPATAAPGDEFLVSVGVFNNTTGGKGPIRVEVRPSAGLSIVGSGAVDLRDPRQTRRRRRVPHPGQRGSGQRLVDLRREPRRLAGTERRERERPSSRGLPDAADARSREGRERGRASHPRHVHGTSHR